MSTFSALSAASQPFPGIQANALRVAWDAMRRARALPFESARSEPWQQAFAALVAQAGNAIRVHVRSMDCEDAAARAPGRWGEHLAEHPELLAAADLLVRSASEPGPVALDRLVDLCERTVELEIAVARHGNRLARAASAAALSPVL
jgi:hypothetical protein